MQGVELLTSTPIKPENSQKTVDKVLNLAVDSSGAPLKRKRGRPRKHERSTTFNPKRMKLDNEVASESAVNSKKQMTSYESDAIVGAALPPVRGLRTSRAVNYGGVSDKAILAQKKLENILPVRKRSSPKRE